MSSSSVLYHYTWAAWVYSDILIYGIFLMSLWPLTYFHIPIVINFYLTFYKNAGLWGGASLYLILASTFLISAFSDGSWLWFSFYLLVEPSLLFGSYWFYEDAKDWYNNSNLSDDRRIKSDGLSEPSILDEPKHKIYVHKNPFTFFSSLTSPSEFLYIFGLE